MDDNKIISIANGSIFQQNTLVLNNVNLTIDKGEFVYLIGKTGMGKSSLLKTIYGDLPLHEGEGAVVGYDLRELTWKQVPYLRRKIGIIFQDFQLLMDRTISDNLHFVMHATGWKDKQAMVEKTEAVLSMVGLKTKGFKMPHELSGGEQQRVVIARALLNDPELILADEPTGNLDPETSDDIIRLLIQLCTDLGASAVVATHNYALIDKYPNRIIKVEGGKIIDSAEKNKQEEEATE